MRHAPVCPIMQCPTRRLTCLDEVHNGRLCGPSRGTFQRRTAKGPWRGALERDRFEEPSKKGPLCRQKGPRRPTFRATVSMGLGEGPWIVQEGRLEEPSPGAVSSDFFEGIVRRGRFEDVFLRDLPEGPSRKAFAEGPCRGTAEGPSSVSRDRLSRGRPKDRIGPDPSAAVKVRVGQRMEAPLRGCPEGPSRGAIQRDRPKGPSRGGICMDGPEGPFRGAV